MLKDAYLFAKVGADTAENKQNFAEMLPIGRRVPGRAARSGRKGAPPGPPLEERGAGSPGKGVGGWGLRKRRTPVEARGR